MNYLYLETGAVSSRPTLDGLLFCMESRSSLTFYWSMNYKCITTILLVVVWHSGTHWSGSMKLTFIRPG